MVMTDSDDEERRRAYWGDIFYAVRPMAIAMRSDHALQDVLPVVYGDPLLRLTDLNPWYLQAGAIMLGEFERLDREDEKKRMPKSP